jgi:spoIIIJ-associated protein
MKQEKVRKRKSIEVEAQTIKEAVEKALAMLNVERDRVEIKILSEEKKGLFGMHGEKPAKIKVTLKTPFPR